MSVSTAKPASPPLHAATEVEPTQPRSLSPHIWPPWRKGISILVVSYADCLTFLVSMMLAPSVPQVLKTFRPDGNDKSLGSFSVTVYILGFVVGPLLLAPLTDLMGRITILRFTAIFFCIFTIACAGSSSLSMLIVFRFIAGCFGGAPMAIGGGVVNDLYPPGENSRPMAWYSVGTMMGPTVGPVLGGIIAGTLGWRWVFWIAAIMAGVCVIALFTVLKETHEATLNLKADNRSSTSAADRNLTFLQNLKAGWNSQNVPQKLQRSLTIPFSIARHPHALSILLLIGTFNGLLNMIISSLGSVFQYQYGFRPIVAGLSYLGFAFGGMIGLAATPRISDALSKLRPHPDASKRPQYHLPMMIVAGPTASIGLLWYGWSFQAKVHWIVPIIGLSLFGFGYAGMRLSTQMFLVAAVPGFSASALAAHTIASSIGGAIIPLGTFPLYDRVGYGWGNSVIAFVNLGLWLVPLVMYAISEDLGCNWIIEIKK